jgi:hypothetical protein
MKISRVHKLGETKLPILALSTHKTKPIQIKYLLEEEIHMIDHHLLSWRILSI